MKVAVVAWIGSTNLGDDLIFAALIELLGEFDVRRQDITAFSTNPEDTSRKFGVNSVGHLDPVATLRVLRARAVEAPEDAPLEAKPGTLHQPVGADAPALC